MCIQLTILVFWFVRTEFRKTRMYVTSRLEIKKNVRALKSFLKRIPYSMISRCYTRNNSELNYFSSHQDVNYLY